MAADKQYPLSLVIRAVDKATAPLRAVNQAIHEATAPVRQLNNSFRALANEAHIPSIVSGIKGIGAAALGLGATAAGVGYSLWHIVHGAMESGAHLDEMAKRTGLSVDAFAQLRYAAGKAKVGQEEFDGALDKFNRNLGEAKAGGGTLLEFLRKVDPAFAQQIKSVKGTEAAFDLMAEAMKKITDPGKRAALTAAAFGRGSVQMGMFVGQGTEAIGALRAKYLEANGSQEKFAEGAEKLEQSTKAMSGSFTSLRNTIGAEFFPIFGELADRVRQFVVDNKGTLVGWAHEAAEAIGKWSKDGGLERLSAQAKEFAETIKGLASGLKELKPLLDFMVGTVKGISGISDQATLLADKVNGTDNYGTSHGNTGRLAELAGPRTVETTWLSRAVSAYKRSDRNSMLAPNPLESALTAADVISSAAFGDRSYVASPEASGALAGAMQPQAAGPSTGAASMQPNMSQASGEAGAAAPPAKAQLTVKMENLPRGARVQVDADDNTEINTQLGYSMVTP